MDTDQVQPELPIVDTDDRLQTPARPAGGLSRPRDTSSGAVCGEPCEYGGEHASGRHVLHGRCNRPVRLTGEQCWQHRTES